MTYGDSEQHRIQKHAADSLSLNGRRISEYNVLFGPVLHEDDADREEFYSSLSFALIVQRCQQMNHVNVWVIVGKALTQRNQNTLCRNNYTIAAFSTTRFICVDLV